MPDEAGHAGIIPDMNSGRESLPPSAPSMLRFGVFELDLKNGEARKAGLKIKLQPQPFKVLAILASRPGEAVTREEIQREVWGSETFVDFDRGLNVCIQQIRAMLGDDPDAPRYIETLPKRGYRFLVPVGQVEFIAGSSPPAAPSVEQPQQVPVSVSPATDASPQRLGAPRKFGRAGVTALLLLGIGALLVYLYNAVPGGRTSHGIAKPIRSLAVLPLDNFSGDPEQQYFADGMTEAITAELGQIRGLRVPSRTSVTLYRRENKPLRQIARELDVDALIEGSVMRSGDRVRVTVQLLDGSNDQHLWGQSYERDARDVLALQHDLAGAIAEELKLKLTAAEREHLQRTAEVNPEAYAAYLHGRYYWYKRTNDGFRKSIQYYEQAIADDPKYAPPYAGLADAYALLGSSPNDALPPKQAMPKAKEAAQKALQLDDGLAEAHASLAYVSTVYDWDWATAEKEFQRAIDLNPNYAGAHEWYAEFLAARGRGNEALAEMKRARDADPLLVLMHAAVAEALYYSRRYDEVIAQCKQTLELDPDYPLAHFHLGRAYVAKKMYPEAIAEYQKAQASVGEIPALVMSIGYANAMAGNAAAARKALEDLQAQSKKRYVPALYFGAIYTGLGDSNNGIVWLEKAYQEHSDYLIFLNVDPMADTLRSNPRFQALLRKIGIAQ
jgi:TolB-like protein/DNA-binding winged helix-turn-helix (wHTH) protein/Tfp pilus assembly protein PilF